MNNFYRYEQVPQQSQESIYKPRALFRKESIHMYTCIYIYTCVYEYI